MRVKVAADLFAAFWRINLSADKGRFAATFTPASKNTEGV